MFPTSHIVTLWFPGPPKIRLRSSCRWLWQWLLLQLPLFHNAQIHSLTERVERVTRLQLDATHPWWIICKHATGNSKKIQQLFLGATRKSRSIYKCNFTNGIISKKPGAAQILPKKIHDFFCSWLTGPASWIPREAAIRQYPKILMEIGSDSWIRWWIHLCSHGRKDKELTLNKGILLNFRGK